MTDQAVAEKHSRRRHSLPKPACAEARRGRKSRLGRIGARGPREPADVPYLATAKGAARDRSGFLGWKGRTNERRSNLKRQPPGAPKVCDTRLARLQDAVRNRRQRATRDLLDQVRATATILPVRRSTSKTLVSNSSGGWPGRRPRTVTRQIGRPLADVLTASTLVTWNVTFERAISTARSREISAGGRGTQAPRMSMVETNVTSAMRPDARRN